MAKPIEVTDNIKECVDIIDEFVNRKDTPDDKDVINAMKYLKITTLNAIKGENEPEGCPRIRRVENIK